MIHTINCKVYVDVDPSDAEDVAASFARGFSSAVEGFPGGEVVSSDVVNIEATPDEEVREHGLIE